MIDTKALRSKILDLAIQGKLTEQLHEDGTAEELYEQIQDEKEKLIQKGKLKKEKPLPEISEEEIPFEIPENWKWVPLETIGDNIPIAFADGPFGSNLKSEHYTTERQVRIIQLSNIGSDGWKNANEKYTTFEHLATIQRSEVKPGNIVIAKMMPAGRAIIVPANVSDAFVLSSDCIKFVPHPVLNTQYLCYAINSKWYHDQVTKDIHGIGRERTSLSKVKSYSIPLPPLSEQKRIVDIVQRAFSVLDTIDALQARYADNRKALKSKLIDAAIQGKLTDQLPEDGTAEELYCQIQEDRQKRIETGTLRKEKPVAKIDTVPHTIPPTWKWVRLGNITTVLGGKRIPAGRSLTQEDTGHKFIRVSEMKNRTVITDGLLFVPEDIYPLISRYIINKEDVYITVAGTIGRVGKIPPELDGANLTENADRLVFSNLDQDWLIICLSSSEVQKQIELLTTQVAQPKLAIKRIQEFLIPLPPLAEQKRIVAKLDELLPLLEK